MACRDSPQDVGRRCAAAGLGRRRAGLTVAVLLAGLAGCYSFSGGGGLPGHLRTVYVAPIENESTQFGIAESLMDELLRASRQRLGLRLASEEEADTVITAQIRRYRDEAVNFNAEAGVGANVFQRRVTVGVSVEILDVGENLIIWENQSLTGTGEYEPGSQTEEEALVVALENLVQQIVDGAQSQW